MLGSIPLLIIPFILYNLGLTGVIGEAGDPWKTELFHVPMMSGGVFTMTLGDVLVVMDAPVFPGCIVPSRLIQCHRSRANRG